MYLRTPRTQLAVSTFSLALAATYLVARPAEAVTCNTSQTFSGPAGSAMGTPVAMYTTNGTDYVVFGAAIGLYYISSPAGASSWSGIQTLNATSVLNTANSLAAGEATNGGLLIAGGHGYANIYQGSPQRSSPRSTCRAVTPSRPTSESRSQSTRSTRPQPCAMR